MTDLEYQKTVSVAVTIFKGVYALRVARDQNELRGIIFSDFNSLGEDYRILKVFHKVDKERLSKLTETIENLQKGKEVNLDAIL